MQIGPELILPNLVLNDDADDINQYASELLPGQCKNYLSIDSMLDEGNETDHFIIQSF